MVVQGCVVGWRGRVAESVQCLHAHGSSFTLTGPDSTRELFATLPRLTVHVMPAISTIIVTLSGANSRNVPPSHTLFYSERLVWVSLHPPPPPYFILILL